jgi:hypothetical protein
MKIIETKVIVACLLKAVSDPEFLKHESVQSAILRGYGVNPTETSKIIFF